MIARAELVENFDEVVAYENAVEEYGSVKEAAMHDHYPVKKQMIEVEFMFDTKDIVRSWVQPNGITLDFGDNQVWVIKNKKEVLEKLRKRFE